MMALPFLLGKAEPGEPLARLAFDVRRRTLHPHDGRRGRHSLGLRRLGEHLGSRRGDPRSRPEHPPGDDFGGMHPPDRDLRRDDPRLSPRACRCPRSPPPPSEKGSPRAVSADFFRVLLGKSGLLLIALVVMCSTFISLNGNALSGPRAYFAMARGTASSPPRSARSTRNSRRPTSRSWPRPAGRSP